MKYLHAQYRTVFATAGGTPPGTNANEEEYV